MAKHALNLFIKIELFTAFMLLVAKVVPYDGLVDAITALFDFQSAERFSHFILGEPDAEPWEALQVYLSLLINTLIGVPVMSAVLIAFNGIRHKTRSVWLVKEWAFSTLRRLAKIFAFTFIFWMLFRCLPYHVFSRRRCIFSIYSGDIGSFKPAIDDCLLLLNQEENDIQKEFVKSLFPRICGLKMTAVLTSKV